MIRCVCVKIGQYPTIKNLTFSFHCFLAPAPAFGGFGAAPTPAPAFGAQPGKIVSIVL
jgi:hypothetical protein